MADWTHDYFERGYAQRWGLPAPSDEVRRHADGLWTLLRLSPASRVIDIGCGHGRHALALSQRGADVVGVDPAVALLNRARQLTAELGVGIDWVRGDMRRLPFRSGCAAAAVLMDAYGFFDTEEEHAAVLREAARVLTAGGRLVLKVVNGAAILDDFKEAEQQERDGVVISVFNTLTQHPPRMTQTIRISGSRGESEYERRQRLYRDGELRAAVEHAGFEVTAVLAGPDGAAFDPAVSSAIWIVARRRAAHSA